MEHRKLRGNGVDIHIPGLAALGYRAVAPDLRGYGDSDAPPEISSYTL
ncbi:unnamed protein product [Brassica rapa]|uniref:AB hydrolase-1 domain-containing protein n=1 Tax=Brassica campestris TaxID=3711 RepID=A0A8D9HWM8_BRACM|nr:unnamed protein product [Brassica rapa]